AVVSARRMLHRVALLIVLSLVAFCGVASAAAPWEATRDGLQPLPSLSHRVTDLTATLSASEQQVLEAKLADWETQTTNQLVVLIVPTTKPESIEEYSIRLAEAWQIGQK